MNRLSEERQLQIIQHLAQGQSVRATAKLTGANRNTMHRISLWKEVLPDERALKHPLPKYLMDRLRPDFARLHAALDCAESAWEAGEYSTARAGLVQVTDALRAVEKIRLENTIAAPGASSPDEPETRPWTGR